MLTSELSRLAFLSSGVMCAILNYSGTIPERSDALHIRHMYGASSTLHSLSSQVGNGSVLHCLHGSNAINCDTSSTLKNVERCARWWLQVNRTVCTVGRRPYASDLVGKEFVKLCGSNVRGGCL